MNLEKSELEPKQVFEFVGYHLPVRPQIWPGPTNTRPFAEPPGQNTETAIHTGLSGLAAYVLDRFTNSHRKASSPRPVAYKTHTLASQKKKKKLEGT